MEFKNMIWKDTAVVAVGQAIGTGVLIGIFALVGYFDLTVLLGGLAGALLATLNYFIMYLFASKAADKAEQQDVAGGQRLIQMSYMVRMMCLLVALVLLARSGRFHVITLAVPLAFTRPILTVYELILKKGGAKE